MSSIQRLGIFIPVPFRVEIKAPFTQNTGCATIVLHIDSADVPFYREAFKDILIEPEDNPRQISLPEVENIIAGFEDLSCSQAPSVCGCCEELNNEIKRAKKEIGIDK